MLTKTEFFALLNDANNKIGVTAHVTAREERNGMQALIIEQKDAPNAWLSNHKAANTTNAAFKKYNAWLNEWFTARAEEAQARIDVLDIEAAHAEALEINAVIDDAVSRCKPFCDNKNLDHASVMNAVNVVRQRLPQMGYSARITVKMMVSVRRLAKLARQKAAENYRAMMERCAKAGYGCNEIPF